MMSPEEKEELRKTIQIIHDEVYKEAYRKGYGDGYSDGKAGKEKMSWQEVEEEN